MNFQKDTVETRAELAMEMGLCAARPWADYMRTGTVPSFGEEAGYNLGSETDRDRGPSGMR